MPTVRQADTVPPPSPYRAVAVDFDGTLTSKDGPPDDKVLAALADLRGAGIRVVLVTGRIIDDLLGVWPEAAACLDVIVAENGAVLSTPTWRRLLAPPVDRRLDEALAGAGVDFHRGEVLLAAAAADEAAIIGQVRALQLGCQTIANRGALMVLPSGVSKGTGLYHALGHLGLSFHNTAAIGDAENDLVLLETSELGVAVADAVPPLRAAADLVLDETDGAGVARFLQGDVLSGRCVVRSSRWCVQLGTASDGTAVELPAAQCNVLVAGATGTGKSYVAGLLAEQLLLLRYSVLVVDPEGDHLGLSHLGGTLVLGGALDLPEPDEVLRLLHHRYASVVADLSALEAGAAIDFEERLLTRVEAHRQATGLPHWVFLDEADKSVGRTPSRWPAFEPANRGYCLITWHPDDLVPEAVAALDAVVALGSPDPDEDVVALAAAVGAVPRSVVARQLAGPRGSAVLTRRDAPRRAQAFTVGTRSTPHLRHVHKYDRWPLEEHRCFYFRRSPSELTGATSRSLVSLEDELGHCERATLRHHCPRHDFSRWVADVFHDRPLADRLAEVETTVRPESPTAVVEDARMALVRLLQAHLVR